MSFPSGENEGLYTWAFPRRRVRTRVPSPGRPRSGASIRRALHRGQKRAVGGKRRVPKVGVFREPHPPAEARLALLRPGDLGRVKIRYDAPARDPTPGRNGRSVDDFSPVAGGGKGSLVRQVSLAQNPFLAGFRIVPHHRRRPVEPLPVEVIAGIGECGAVVIAEAGGDTAALLPPATPRSAALSNRLASLARARPGVCRSPLGWRPTARIMEIRESGA